MLLRPFTCRTDSSSTHQAVQRAGANKSTNREYYYIDFRRAIDACKYRIHKIDEHVKRNAKPNSEKAEMRCPRCKAQYTTMEVMSSIDPEPTPESSGFLCLRCGHPLDEIDVGGEADEDADDTPAKFNKMFRPLLDLMAELDQMKVPETTGEEALANAIELPRDKTLDPGTAHTVLESVTVRPATVKGRDTGPTKLDVQIESSAEQNEKQRAAEKAAQAQRLEQNAVPEWIQKSTVEKNSNGALPAVKQEANDASTPEIKVETAPEVKANIIDLFAQMAKERDAKAAQEDEYDDDEEDDEEEDDFEDVIADTPSAMPEAKRIKLDSSAAPTPSNVATPVSTGDGGDESEEDEFEDVK